MARGFVAASTQRLGYAGAPVLVAPLTIAAWVRPVNNASNYGLVSLSAFASTNHFFELYLSSGGVVTAQAGGAAAAPVASASGATTTGAWNHAAAVFSSESSRAAYLNGGNKGTDATASGTPNALDTTSLGSYDTVSTRFFYLNGDLAEVGIWNAALDDAEVAGLAAGISPLLIRPSSLVAYWPLVGNDSPEPDRWKNRYDLTLTNTPTKADHPRMYYPDGPSSSLNAASASAAAGHRMFLVF